MELEEIKSKIKNHVMFDECTINILAEYLYAVQNKLKDVISFEEAFKRIIESNLMTNGIVVLDDEKMTERAIKQGALEWDASFSVSDKCIFITKSLENRGWDNIKCIIFHELTHILSDQKDMEKHYSGVACKNIGVCMDNHRGINEAITDYIAFKLYGENIAETRADGYIVAEEQFENMLEVVDEKEVLDCYFFHGEKFDELIEKKSTFKSYEFEYYFNVLENAEEEIVRIRKNASTTNQTNIELLVIKENLYYWYTSKFCPVDSMEKFEKKLDFVKKYINQCDSLNYVDAYGTYVDIICDMQDLFKIGFSEDKLECVAKNHGFDMETAKLYEKFGFLNDSDENGNIRTVNAIKLYEMRQKLGTTKFNAVCSQFFLRLYYNFFEGNPINSDDLKSYMKIVVMGKFLKNNSQYKFDDLGITNIDYSITYKDTNKETKTAYEWFYIINTPDQKKHVVFDEFADGTAYTLSGLDRDTIKVAYKNYSFAIKLNGNGGLAMYGITSPNYKYCPKVAYSRRSNNDIKHNKADNIER